VTQIAFISTVERVKPITTYHLDFHDRAAFAELDHQMISLGFGQWIFSSVANNHLSTNTAVQRVSSYPRGFIDDYNHHGFSTVDPSTPYWLTHNEAASYRKVRRSVSLSPKQKNLMNLNRDHGVNKGIVIPLSNVLGFKSVLALSFEGTIEELNTYIGDVRNTLFSTSKSFNRQFLSRHKSHFLNSNIPSLTPQQARILSLLAQGLLTKQIADRLSISANGVDKHVAKIKYSLSAKTTAEAVALSIQWQLI